MSLFLHRSGIQSSQRNRFVDYALSFFNNNGSGDFGWVRPLLFIDLYDVGRAFTGFNSDGTDDFGWNDVLEVTTEPLFISTKAVGYGSQGAEATIYGTEEDDLLVAVVSRRGKFQLEPMLVPEGFTLLDYVSNRLGNNGNFPILICAKRITSDETYTVDLTHREIEQFHHTTLQLLRFRGIENITNVSYVTDEIKQIYTIPSYSISEGRKSITGTLVSYWNSWNTSSFFPLNHNLVINRPMIDDTLRQSMFTGVKQPESEMVVISEQMEDLGSDVNFGYFNLQLSEVGDYLPLPVLPTIKDYAHANTTNGFTSTYTSSKPDNVEEGDLLMALFMGRSGNAGGDFIDPTGWTRLIDENINMLNEACGAIFYKIASDTEPSSYDFSHEESIRGNLFLLNIKNSNTANPILESESNKTTTPTVLTSAQKSLRIMAYVSAGTDITNEYDYLEVPGSIVLSNYSSSTVNSHVFFGCSHVRGDGAVQQSTMNGSTNATFTVLINPI